MRLIKTLKCHEILQNLWAQQVTSADTLQLNLIVNITLYTWEKMLIYFVKKNALSALGNFP